MIAGIISMIFAFTAGGLWMCRFAGQHRGRDGAAIPADREDDRQSMPPGIPGDSLTDHPAGDGLVWTALDELQLRRLLNESSPERAVPRADCWCSRDPLAPASSARQ
jgi:hypothetical protein